MPVTAGTTDIYLPDGRLSRPPVDPRIWVEGEPLSANLLARDVSSAVAWHRQRPLFVGLSTSATAIASSTWTLIPLHAELVDNYAGHTDASNSSRWYAPETENFTEYYLVTAYVPVSYTGGTGPSFITGLRVNGAGTIYEGNKISATSGHVVNGQVIDLIGMNPGDYVQAMAWHNTGASQNTSVSGKCPSLHARWVCAYPIDTVNRPATLRTWTDTDLVTADATGTVGSSTKVPVNREVRDVIRYLHQPPTLRVTSQGTAQTVAANTWTAINMASQTFDTHAMWAVSPNPSRIVCTQAGLYYVAGLFAVDSDATPASYVQARLRHTILAGGTADYYGQSAMRATGAASPGDAVYATGMIRMAAGDYVELMGWQNDGTKAVKTAAGDCARVIAIQMAA